jgi:SAM-dependent methyltransferase
MTEDFRRTLLANASRPYRASGVFAWKFAKGKLKGDPAFFGLLEYGLIPDAKRLIDLGCGQGLLASWLLEARTLYESGNWPDQWPAAPKIENIWGLELMPRDVERARAALGSKAEFVLGDICSTNFSTTNVVVVLDVLHYLSYEAQEDVLRRIRASLPAGGTFITRIGDAAGGLPFHYSNWVDRTVFFLRGHRLNRIYCRTLKDWLELISRTGFTVKQIPMHKGTPFCNIMLIAQAA